MKQYSEIELEIVLLEEDVVRTSVSNGGEDGNGNANFNEEYPQGWW